MRSLFSSRLLPAIALQTGSLLLLAASAAHAADSTYIGNGTAAANYVDAPNWQGGIVPGLNTGTATPTAAQQNADIATFDSGTITTAQALNLTSAYSLGGLHFVAGAAAYTVSNNPSSARFYINTGGSVLMDAGVTTAQNVARTGMIVGAGGGTTTTYENNSTTSTAILTTSSFNNANGTSGTVILTGTNTGVNSFANGNAVAITNGSSVLSFIKNGTGTWLFGTGNAANTFTGGVTINNGTLRIAAGSSAFNPIGSGTLTINGGTLGSYNGGNRTISNAFSLGASATIGDSFGGAFTLTGAGTLTANTTLAANQATTISGAIGDGTTGSGFGLISNGTATLTLGVRNTYRGGTTVTAGMLSVTANGALGTGNVTITGGVLTLAATVTDGIADTATLSLSGSGTANLLGTTTETVSGLILGGVAQAAGMTYNSTNSSNFITGTGSITVMAVPEPSTWVCGLLGLALLARLGLKKRPSAV